VDKSSDSDRYPAKVLTFLS